ncbi:hypothetical protein GQX73_g1215 [Xylaria multiplex]|uniref:Uncharacterized protein n=1 Tax=Xylaria multiplex TaxID=323545 RepID=A0A7C8J0V3_9PEZI|nr:hypothetical protein GQX73_g1215 [Xylaria multiplex]
MQATPKGATHAPQTGSFAIDPTGYNRSAAGALPRGSWRARGPREDRGSRCRRGCHGRASSQQESRQLRERNRCGPDHVPSGRLKVPGVLTISPLRPGVMVAFSALIASSAIRWLSAGTGVSLAGAGAVGWLYQQKVGSILYAAVITRPDIAFGASRLVRFNHNPSPEHHKAADRLLSYTDDWLNKITRADTEGADVTEPFKLTTDLEKAHDLPTLPRPLRFGTVTVLKL